MLAAGLFSEFCSVERMHAVQSASGATSKQWVLLCALRCYRLRKESGMVTESGHEEFIRERTTLIVRKNKQITPKMRVRYADKLWRIVSIHSADGDTALNLISQDE